MKHIAVEYNHDLKPLEALLLGVTHPGDFFIDGAMEIPMPRIQVEGVGTLSFPIPHSQIEAMVHQATQAPYGRGQETVVDTAVRNVWQISPNAVHIGAKSWETTFNNILSKVTTGLGCPDPTISAELYKLLIYETGGFFLAHRDTEKAPGMFGTLVLTLPSAHRGEALRIRHAGREAIAASNAAGPCELAFAAFYADCEHEVLPVLEGYRVCLVYNLIQRPGKTGVQRLRAPDYESQIEKAGAILKAFWKAPGKAQKLAWILTNEFYTEISGHPIPADLEAIKVLAAAPALLDLFMWLSYRCFVAKGPEVIPLFGPFGLTQQLGCVKYSRPRRFRAMLEQWLRTIRCLWPECPALISAVGRTLRIDRRTAILPIPIAT